nr:MAG TPA: crystallin beta/gamma motif-containing protein [Caudoviricetes sp.]
MTLSKNDLPSAQVPQTNFDTEAAGPTYGGLLVENLPSRRHHTVTDNLESASQLNPDREATVQRLSKQTGYAPEFISANFEDFQKHQALPGKAELDVLQNAAPETYSLLNDKETVPLIQDEYKKMGFFERNFKMVLNAFKKSWKQDTLADLRIRQRQNDLQTKKYGNEYDDEILLLEREIADLAAPSGNVISRAPYHATEFATQILLSQPDAIAGAAGGAAVGGAVGAGVGAAGLGAGAVPGAITGATWGARGGYVAGMAKYANDIEGGLAYGDLRNLRDANGNPVPVELADKASRTVGYINAALETAGDLIFIGGVLKPAGKLAGKIGSKFVGKSLSGALGKTLAKVPGAEGLIKIIEGNPAAFEGLTLRQTFAKAAKQWAITTASETATEYAQNVVQLTAEEAAKAASKQPFERRTFSSVMGESLEGMDEVAVGSGALGLIGFGGNFHRHMRATKEAASVGQLYKQLGEGVKELKLTERSPDKAIAFLASQTNGTPIENVYIPITAIDRVAEENNIDPREFLQAIGPEAAGQYDEAKATGGDIEIKTASWAVQSQLYSKLTGKPIYEALERDIKISPEGRTQNELAAEEQEVAKIVNEQAEQMLKEGQIKQDELDTATQTWTNVLAQSVPPAGIEAEEWQKQVEANAQLMARMSVVEAKKRGQDFAEFAEHLNLPTVQTQLAPEQQQAFNQAKEVYAKIKDALTQNEETLAAQEKGGATPIIDYLLKRGGVATENTDWAGETENWRRKESNIYGLVNNKNGMKLYEAALAVQEYLEENGYGSLINLDDTGATTADVPDLINAVNEEMGKYIPLTKRDRYNKRLNEILNVNSGQFKTLFEKEFGEKLPDRGTRALKNLHYFLLREAVKDGMKPSESVLAEHNINAEALTAGSFDFAQENANADLFQEINALNQFDPNAPDNSFVKSKWGGVAHGVISPEIAQTANIQPGEIRVYNSLLKHLSVVKKGETMSRLEQIGKLGYDNPVEFIDEVMERLALIQRGNDGSLLLTGKVGLNHTVAVKLEPGNGFYKVTTLMPRRKLGNKKAVWEAALPLRENSRTTGEIGSAKEPSGPNGTISIANKNPKIKAQNAKTDPNSAAFKKWFKNSKVVDENGKPLVVYHGTKQGDFSSFDKSKIGAQTDYGYRGKGFYFTPQQELAAMYSRDWQKFKQVPNENGRVMPVYLSVQNPYIIKSKDAHNILSKFESESFTRKLQEQGYDGVFVEMDDLVKSYDGELQEIIVFEPTQIKSVYNRGTFDENDANVYFQAVYHGSPHVFDKFALSAIGTGEGAQAHGWGLYFAGNKETAERYREKLSRGIPRPDDVLIYDGKEYLPGDKSIMREALDYVNDRGSKDKAARVLAKLKDDSEFYAKFWKDNEKYAAENKKSAEHYAELLRIVEGLDPKKFTFKKGKLYEVEIPENDVLLNEDKTFSEQPEKVKNAVLALAEDNEILPELTTQEGRDNMTGRGIYESIARHFAYLGTDQGGTAPIEILNRTEYAKAASLELNKHGIKGISYDGHLDGECFVIFDDKAVDILNLYYQEAAGRMRGKFNELTNTITLTPDANASTLTHELAHYWLNERWRFLNSGLADANYKKDFEPLAKYLDIKEGQKELTREQHEKFAKSFEAYLREGKSPSLEMERLFGRLRRWMLRVYKNVKKQLGVELNDDIRRVFDRMLATEEEIVAAERERTYEPFTKTPGLSAEDVARLERLREDAHNAAVLQIMKEEHEEWDYTNKQKEIYAYEREYENVEKELAARSDYQLANIVESHFVESQYAKDHGKTDANNLASAKELAHAFHANLLSEADRTLWTVLAENNGMTATQMAEEFVALKPFREAVDDETEKRMQKYKFSSDMRDLRRAQAEALSNDRALDVLALERDLFLNYKRTASVQRAQETKALAKKAAREWLHSKPARLAARFSPYYTAQKRAATRAARALARQDYEAAAQAKMEELFNAAAAAESVRISKQLRRLQETLKYFQRKKITLLKKQEHYLQMADLLARLGYARNDYDPSMKIESLAAWVKRYKDLGYDGVMIPDWITNESRNLEWRRLSIDSLQQAVDALKNISHTANFENRLFSMHRRKTIDDLAFMVSQHLSKTISKKTREKLKDQVEPEKDGFFSGMEKYFYSMTKLDTLLHKADGYHDFGFMYDLFGKPTKEAADKESVHLRAFKDAYKKLIDEHYTQDELQEIFTTKKYHPELGDECTKERLLAMALNMGNEQNRKRLFDNPPVGFRYLKNPDGTTNEWTQESVERLLRNNLTAKDWDFVQGVWDLINEPWGEVSKMHQMLTGFTPGKVEPLSFAIATADGKTAKLRGGYYPIKYDWRGSRWAEREEYLAQPLYTESNQAWAATTKQGHTKARAKDVRQPLALNLNLVERHMTEVIHDLYFRPVVVDLRRLLDNDYMRETLIKNLGRNGYGLLKAHLNMIATGGQETSGIGVINKTVEWLRKHTTIAVLAGKSSVIIENLANPWLFTNAVEGFTGKDVLKGVGLALSEYGPQSLLGMEHAKQLQAYVFSKSPMMKDKSENYDVTMRQLRKANIFGEDSMLLEFTNAAMVATDDFFAIPMWVTAYNKWFDMATKEGKNEKEADRIAIDRADMLINRVLGSGRRYDAAEIMRNRNAIVRCLTMFATFMNNEFNRWSRETGLLLEEHDAIRYAGFVGGRLLVWHTVSQLLAGKWPDDLSPDELLKWWFSGLVDNVSGMFVGVRDILPVLLAKAMGWQSFGYRPTPISGTLEEMILRPAEAVSGYVRGKKKGQDATETVAKAASYLAPYPNQLNTWFFNAYDYVFNGSTPRPRDLYRRRPKKERGN